MKYMNQWRYPSSHYGYEIIDEVMHPEDGSSTFLRNGTDGLNYTASYPRGK
jgi:hypothetical protein